MTNAIGSVIIASAQSVAKVFVIGGVGCLTVMYPRKAPFLPRHLVGNVARFTFHALTIPLIYSTIALAVTLESVGDYWFVILGGFTVLGTSYLVATLLKCCIPIANPRDFYALRIAATFPNIVALPILIFPSLCEFAVVHEGYFPRDEDLDVPIDSSQLQRQCEAQANTMIFIYFFTWSLLFWSFGHPQLMQATKMKAKSSVASVTSKAEDELSVIAGVADDDEAKRSRSGDENDTAPDNDNNAQESEEESDSTVFQNVCNAVKQTTTSPGFIALALAFITACIPPLQRALFEPGAPLRFLGSAVETLGIASSPISTMVVAASLMPPSSMDERSEDEQDDAAAVIDENPAMTDPNFGPYRRRRRARSPSRRLHELRRSMQSGSMRILNAIPRSSPEMKRLHVWFCLSRLIVTPAVIVGLIVAVDCGTGWLDGVPNLAKLVIIINSALPGALIVVVILKSKEEMAETAAAVAKVYLPSYLLAIVSIAAWTAVGLWLTLPDEEGNSVCQRR
mmetsp:Transcript_81076/g.121865  ORF Transcript_81076/g.121865 Transcript_81076/m.121865 type:complete len:509 (+) Transcript_81076:55-1581(+)